MTEIVNKVQQSKLETVDLEKFLEEETVREIDLKQFLFKEMILKEKDFRDNLENHDWSQYEDSWSALYCSSDAIIPSWAWMLVTTCLYPYAKEIIYGDETDARQALLRDKVDKFDWEVYRDKFVLLKGCSKTKVPAGAYLEATKRLIPVAGKLMYGEACSNVPIYRKSRNKK
ncbi:MAG: DUF2480 family protein [Balneolaceae bacterium]